MSALLRSARCGAECGQLDLASVPYTALRYVSLDPAPPPRPAPATYTLPPTLHDIAAFYSGDVASHIYQYLLISTNTHTISADPGPEADLLGLVLARLELVAGSSRPQQGHVIKERAGHKEARPDPGHQHLAPPARPRRQAKVTQAKMTHTKVAQPAAAKTKVTQPAAANTRAKPRSKWPEVQVSIKL